MGESEQGTSDDRESGRAKTAAEPAIPADTGRTESAHPKVTWLPPATPEEWTLFDQLLNDIKLMYAFARDRGIAPPRAVVDGLPELLSVSKQASPRTAPPPETKPSETAAAPEPGDP